MLSRQHGGIQSLDVKPAGESGVASAGMLHRSVQNYCLVSIFVFYPAAKVFSYLN